MALPTIFKLLVEAAASETLVKNVKKAWAKSPWAKDPNRVNSVERKIDELAHELGRLARGLAPDAVGPEVERRMTRFERELQELGVPEPDAKELRQSVATGLETTVLEPIAEARRLQGRIETLERENLDSAKRIEALEPLATRTLEAEKRWAAANAVSLVALGLSALAVLAVLLLAIARR